MQSEPAVNYPPGFCAKWGRGEERERQREGETEARRGREKRPSQHSRQPPPCGGSTAGEGPRLPPTAPARPAALNVSYLAPRNSDPGARGAPQRLPMQPACPEEGPRRGPPPRAGQGPSPGRRRQGGCGSEGVAPQCQVRARRRGQAGTRPPSPPAQGRTARSPAPALAPGPGLGPGAAEVRRPARAKPRPRGGGGRRAALAEGSRLGGGTRAL